MAPTHWNQFPSGSQTAPMTPATPMDPYVPPFTSCPPPPGRARPHHVVHVALPESLQGVEHADAQEDPSDPVSGLLRGEGRAHGQERQGLQVDTSDAVPHELTGHVPELQDLYSVLGDQEYADEPHSAGQPEAQRCPIPSARRD